MEIKKGRNKFYIGESEEAPIAEITYQNKDDHTIVVDHTYVSDTLRGQGIAGKLVEVITDYAREEGVKIIPTCSYVASKMEKTAAYHDLLAQ